MTDKKIAVSELHSFLCQLKTALHRDKWVFATKAAARMRIITDGKITRRQIKALLDNHLDEIIRMTA